MPGTLPAGPARVHDLDAFAGPRVQPRDVFGRVLEVAVHDDDPAAARGLDAGRDRRVLAEVATEPDEAHGVVLVGELAEDAPGLVRAAIVDEDDLVLAGNLRESESRGARVGAGGTRALVDRDDDADLDVIHRELSEEGRPRSEIWPLGDPLGAGLRVRVAGAAQGRGAPFAVAGLAEHHDLSGVDRSSNSRISVSLSAAPRPR